MGKYPNRLRNFQLGCAYTDGAFLVVGMYDFGALASPNDDPSRPLLIDIGGGAGQAIADIVKAFPALDPKRFILQDLEPVINHANAAGVLPKESKAMITDFWQEQPIKNAKAYFLRRVLHDYSDKKCIELLKRTCDAMGDDSVVLISEMVLPRKVDEVNLSAAAMDNFMFTLGGKERTEEGFKTILEGAGFEMVKIHRIDERLATGCLIEGRKKGVVNGA
jgi:hypothetical protein